MQVLPILEGLDHPFVLRDRSSQSKFHLTKICIHKQVAIRSFNTGPKDFIARNLLVVGVDAGHSPAFRSKL